ncbi:cyclodeaminase/cyclohydrolase family protein [Haloferax sp. Q22]|uniref:cyclodeaminase/cyclohydrolase family protein n=1 Tax=Haloferax sp. (strain Q22) TaxID=1526048 RepID=UPI000737D489|nr:cyclodeaminase/cyclohydrolase family protein [Haloferax sp. Q22]
MGLESQPIGVFLSEVASENVAPAGGSCAAVVGAMGASLCEMACIHTVNDEEHTDGKPDLVDAGEELTSLREQLLHLAEADAAVVAGLPAAFDGNQTHVKRATGIPLAIAESCLHVLEAAIVVTAEGKKTVLPDVKSGMFFTEAALRAALFTVRTNIGYLDNPSFVEKMNQQTDEIEASAENMLDEIRPKLAI